MNFVEAVNSCLRQPFTFSGRSARSEYWYFALFQVSYTLIDKIALHFMNQAILKAHHDLNMLLLCVAGSLISVVLTFWIGFSSLSVYIRRLHDRDRSGYWWWVGLTIIGAIFPLLVWTCRKGTEGPNRYGPDPLQEADGNMIR